MRSMIVWSNVGAIRIPGFGGVLVAAEDVREDPVSDFTWKLREQRRRRLVDAR